MSKKNKIISAKKVIIPHQGFYENYLTWQIANCTPATAHVLGVARFIVFVFVLLATILTLIYLPHLLGYFSKI